MKFIIATITLVIATVAAAPSSNVAQSAPVIPKGLEKVPGGFTARVKKEYRGPALSKRQPYATTNDRWWLSLGVGTPPQDLNFLPDTGSNGFSIQSTLIPQSQRGNSFLYNPSKSSSAKQIQGCTYSEAFTGYTDSGLCYTETIHVADTTFTSVVLEVETQVSSPNINGRTGNLGLNHDSGQSTSTREPTFMQSIALALPNYTVSINYNTYTKNGELDFGFIDPSKYNGTLNYLAVNSGTSQWDVTFAGIQTTGGKYHTNNFPILIDTGGPHGTSTLPRDMLDAFFAQISGASFNSNLNTYTFPCNGPTPDMVMLAGFLPLHVPPSSWVGGQVGSSSNCACTFTASGDETAFFGEDFIEGVFIVLDYKNLQVGFANKPAQTQAITYPTYTNSISMFTQPSFEGNETTYVATSAVCYNLQSTIYYNSVGSFFTNRGSCTIYADTGCSSVTSANGTTFDVNAINPSGSFMCLWPDDYPPYGSGNLKLCPAANFGGSCVTTNWKSYSCQQIPASVKKNFQSASPNQGYCTFYTDNFCSQPIQNSAPMATPGESNIQWGVKSQSFMCT